MGHILRLLFCHCKGQKGQSLCRSDMETVRMGYQVAVNLAVYESQMVWSRFSTMVLANSILYGGIILILTSEKSEKLLPLALLMSIGGLVLCIFWGWMTHLGTSYYKRFIEEAKCLEKQHLGPLKTLQGPPKNCLPIRCVSYIVIGLFKLGYVALLVVALVIR